MKSIAIIGTGIAGLGCAHLLHRRARLTLFEANDYVGGHSHTISVEENEGTVVLDSGFMVYNEVTYPLLTRLFETLGVITKPTTMSFSVQHGSSGTEWNGTGLNTLFGQRRNLFDVRHWRFLVQLNRFNQEAFQALGEPEWNAMTLHEYVEARGYGKAFLERYLLPMASAVWSAPRERMMQFPAVTLLRFWHNHGFLGPNTQHPWRTVEGGARQYVDRLIEPFREQIRLNAPVSGVRLAASGAEVESRFGVERFDQVVMASHADQSLRMLKTPTPLQRELLSRFAYQGNDVRVHTSPQFMPSTRRCWASWNVRTDRADRNSIHYWMNSLQGVSKKRDYFVSLNAPEVIREDQLRRALRYEHPLFDLPAIDAQSRLPELNRESHRRVFFCGSYFGYGFHEDAFRSAVDLCRELEGKDLMEDLAA